MRFVNIIYESLLLVAVFSI